MPAADGRRADGGGQDAGQLGHGAVAADAAVDLGAGAVEGGAAGGYELAAAVDGGLVAQSCQASAAAADAGALDLHLQVGRCGAHAQLRGVHGVVQVPHQELVAERDAELGMGEERTDLSDGFGAEERVVLSVDRGEEAVGAGPLGGDGEVGVALPPPAGEEDLCHGGAVDKLLGNSARQRRNHAERPTGLQPFDRELTVGGVDGHCRKGRD
ncbi:hypothetical protein GCM10020000_75260 [Streptomyces olivoverticillatus]